MLLSEIVGLTYVQNMDDTSDEVPPYPDEDLSWKDWWEKKSGSTFGRCSCFGCRNDAEVGAHVQKQSFDGKSYIVPLCKGCNNKSSDISFRVYCEDLVEIK